MPTERVPWWRHRACPGTGRSPEKKTQELQRWSHGQHSGRIFQFARGKCPECGRNITLSPRYDTMHPHVAVDSYGKPVWSLLDERKK